MASDQAPSDEAKSPESAPPSPPVPDLHLPPLAPVLLAPSQETAFARLHSIATVYFSTAWHHLPICPRLSPLLVAPSGAGKTFLAQFLARTFSASFLRLSYGEWQPMGARSSGHTHAFDRIHRLLSEAHRAVILIDELEKMRPEGGLEWSHCIFQELLVLLDRNPSITSHSSSWQPAALETLRRRTLIIGAGTWQTLWAAPRRAGFNDEPREDPIDEVSRRIELSARIPEELLMRFDGRFVTISPYTAEDFQHLIEEHNRHVPSELRIDLHPELLGQLVASRRNMRAMQELVSQRLLQMAAESPDEIEYDIPF
ncbi:MAG: AAA family ATPase [Verrucomicrobiae bacterium]|nr:AAA family ATPase [Verrucomicrobiae bacterium]